MCLEVLVEISIAVNFLATNFAFYFLLRVQLSPSMAQHHLSEIKSNFNGRYKDVKFSDEIDNGTRYREKEGERKDVRKEEERMNE